MRNTSHARAGFVLPTVVFAMVLVALLAAAVQSVALRADRQARLGFAGEHALLAADAAIARRMAAWNARDFAAMPIGARDQATIADGRAANGLMADVILVRTNATNAWIEATVRNAHDGNVLPARRRVARFVTVASPPLPLTAAATVLGVVRLDDANALRGSDVPPPDWTTDCNGVDRAPDVAPLSATAFTGAPPALAQLARDSLEARALFDAQWPEWRARAATVDAPQATRTLIPDDEGGRCAPATGDPLRGAGASSACISEFGARFIATSGSVTMAGDSRYQGVLMIDGDLVIDGDLRVDGLLIVRGALTAVTGRLTLNGSLLVRDDSGHGSRIGTASRIQYSRCAMQKALAATGMPSISTTHSWFERP